MTGRSPWKLDMTGVPDRIARDGVGIGDVFMNQRARFQLIVAISGQTAYYLLFNGDGEPCGAGQMGVHAFERRPRVGFVPVMPPLEIEWEEWVVQDVSGTGRNNT